MKLRARGSILLIATCFSAAAVLADTASLKKVLQAKYDKLNSAIISRDVRAASAVLAPSFNYVRHDGTRMPRAQFIQEMKAQFSQGRIVESVDVVKKVTVKGKTATAEVENKMSSLVKDPQGNQHISTTIAPFRDTWVLKNGNWLNSETREMAAPTELLDGKPAPQPGGE